MENFSWFPNMPHLGYPSGTAQPRFGYGLIPESFGRATSCQPEDTEPDHGTFVASKMEKKGEDNHEEILAEPGCLQKYIDRNADMGYCKEKKRG